MGSTKAGVLLTLLAVVGVPNALAAGEAGEVRTIVGVGTSQGTAVRAWQSRPTYSVSTLRLGASGEGFGARLTLIPTPNVTGEWEFSADAVARLANEGPFYFKPIGGIAVAHPGALWPPRVRAGAEVGLTAIRGGIGLEAGLAAVYSFPPSRLFAGEWVVSAGMSILLGFGARPPPTPSDPPVDPLDQAARLHGEVEGRLHTLQREIQELGGSRELGVPTRPWSLEHIFAASGMPEPILERGRRAQEMVEAGLAEEGADGWHSTVLERAIEGEVITSEADQGRFLAIAEREQREVVVRWAMWRATEMALSLTPARGAGAGGMLFARAPQSTSAALTALNTTVRSTGIRGQYVNVVESMSVRAIRFQELVAGGIRAGTSFLHNGVKFDYLDAARRLLVEAKGPGYVNFVDKAGDFYSWFRGRKSLADQASRQIQAAAGESIEWVFAERRAMEATRRLFERLDETDAVRRAMVSGQLTMRVR